MCGIAGLFGSEWNRFQLERMATVQQHRGPDDRGFFVDESGMAALAHNRLSILDLSPAGHQPMANVAGNLRIVFNGEIYNFQELKKELESLGHHFKTNSDTETIVHAYEEFGAQCLEKLRGMFAFAIWNKREESLFIARDRVGKKPLFYNLNNS